MAGFAVANVVSKVTPETDWQVGSVTATEAAASFTGTVQCSPLIPFQTS